MFRVTIKILFLKGGRITSARNTRRSGMGSLRIDARCKLLTAVDFTL